MLFTLAGASFSQSISASDSALNAYSEILSEHVTKDGLIDYKKLSPRTSEIESFIKTISLSKEDLNTGKQTTAYLINQYNAIVILGVLKNKNEESVQNIGDFFTAKNYDSPWGKVSLNELESHLISEIFKDPRIHFVLNCGAASCPPLRPEAFYPKDIESQIENQTRIAINDKRIVRVNDHNGKAYVSEIFDWYEEDFDQVGGVRAFINTYLDDPLPDSMDIVYMQYDWSKNQTPDNTGEKKK